MGPFCDASVDPYKSPKWCKPYRCEMLTAHCNSSGSLVSDSLEELAELARALLAGDSPMSPLAPALRAASGPIFAELRQGGRLVQSWTATKQDQWEALHCLRQASTDVSRLADRLHLAFCQRAVKVNLASQSGWSCFVANSRRGLDAYALQYGGHVLFLSPFTIVSQNRTPAAILTRFAAQHGVAAEEAKLQVRADRYNTDQYVIELGDSRASAARLFRGNRLVGLAELTKPFVERLAELLSDYLVRSVNPDGRMSYLYYPSRGGEDLAKNNAIRQWMATRALIQAWRRKNTDQLLAVLRTNISYNLATMYGEENCLGLIFDGDKVKLGAIALAALALRESPFASDYESVYFRLRTTVGALWKASGEFQTFYRPAKRNDCQNFYPGEALLFWSRVLADQQGPALCDRFWKSFEWYQRWHRLNRNPAFVPWHTQAYFNVWKRDRDDRLAAAVFEMNDWLLSVQQWDTAPQPDCQGRFYDPDRPFGPPHASSTGVYLEGLADAFALAQELGEEQKAGNYRMAILRGLRSIAQLTFKDDADMFYISKRDRLRGGVRTNEYDNIVRIDNVQHCLMAIYKVLDCFTDEDYQSRGAGFSAS